MTFILYKIVQGCGWVSDGSRMKNTSNNSCTSVFSREILTEKQRFNCGKRSCYLID